MVDLGFCRIDRLVHGVLPAKGVTGNQKKSALNTSRPLMILGHQCLLAQSKKFEIHLECVAQLAAV